MFKKDKDNSGPWKPGSFEPYTGPNKAAHEHELQRQQSAQEKPKTQFSSSNTFSAGSSKKGSSNTFSKT